MSRSDPPPVGAPGRSGVRRSQRAGPNLLCVANYPANTGYAWDFIESLYAGIADRLTARGVTTWVAYPSMPALPEALRGSEARAVEMGVRLDSLGSMRAVLSFVRHNEVSILYLADQPVWHPLYAALRLAGVRRIVVHDHTSGERTVPRGAKRLMKRARYWIPGAVADYVLAVSDYVARRKVEVDLVPPERIRRIWNSVPVPDPDPLARSRIRALFGLAASRPVIACACRASPEKGLVHLLRAFDRLTASLKATTEEPALIYFGDGPAFQQLQAERNRLAARGAIYFAGHRSDAADLIGGADVCVAPSLWAEAFGLYALEPLARGVPVIASRAGAIPEVVVDGETGLLIEPGDEVALEDAMRRLVENPEEARRLGEAGRRRVAVDFSRDRQIEELLFVLADANASVPRARSPIGLARPRGSADGGAVQSSVVAAEGSKR